MYQNRTARRGGGYSAILILKLQIIWEASFQKEKRKIKREREGGREVKGGSKDKFDCGMKILRSD